MPRQRKQKPDVNLEEDFLEGKPPTIEPYTVLGIDKRATADEVKAAYRKTALKHHPDKAPADLKDEATTKFQEVAFAYAVLSDPIRRKRYDTTGSTSESFDAEEGFSWTEFYAEQFRDVISGDAIETFSKAYKGSDEEKDDLLAAYVKFKGVWEGMYSVVMLSDPLEDEDRYRVIIDAAIEEGEVEGYKAYVNETAKTKEVRMKKAKRDGKEAEAYAKKLGVHDKLFGKEGEKSEKAGGEDALAALIMKRQVGRGNFLDKLEEKYAAPKKTNKKGKLEMDEPSEEAFQEAAARLKNGKSKTKASDDASEGGRKSKRAKH